MEEYSLIEGRGLTQFPVLEALDLQVYKTAAKQALQGQPGKALEMAVDQLGGRNFAQKVEVAATDQFPLRISLIQRAKALERG